MATLVTCLPDAPPHLAQRIDRSAREVSYSPGPRRTTHQHDTVFDTPPLSIPVPGISRDIQVKLAAETEEWEQAFRLVGDNYRARGYEAADSKPVRFTPYHALPDTVTFVAKHEGLVVATMSLVADNRLTGLPMESIYQAEITDLRRLGRRLGETTSLADTGLSTREFLQVFVTLIRVNMQYHVSRGGDTWVITVNPRHRNFYCKVMGFASLGPCRDYPSVQDAPAEAYVLDLDLMQANAPKMYEQIFGENLPRQALMTPRMSPHVVRNLADQSSQTDPQSIHETLSHVEQYGSPRRW